jgi:dolichol-phosphate mannosyltransferase
MDTEALISVVVPVYNEASGLRHFHERTTAALEAIPDAHHELVYVDDGSEDETFSLLREIAEADSRVRVVKFSRNFGHQIAITAGMDHARGDCGVVIDADLQDPPEVIGEMVAAWRKGFDVVYGVRSTRAGESRMKLATAAAFYRILRRIVGIDIPLDAGDFRLLSRRAMNVLAGMREKDRFVRGLVSWVGFQQTGVEYERDERFAGETKYPYSKMFKFALDGITSFSSLPLRLATWLGWATSLLAFAYILTLPIQILRGITVDGFPTIMAAVLFLGGVQLICLGIMGEYVGRIFNEVKPRPLYLVEERIGDMPEPPAGREA